LKGLPVSTNPPNHPAYPPTPPPGYYQQPLPPGISDKKILIGIMGILLGSYGVHRFLLGDTTGGILRIVLTFVTFGLASLIGIIEGIIYLTKTDEQFYYEYIVNRKDWF
jgi:TM2 domain-containing membrane protein YozV